MQATAGHAPATRLLQRCLQPAAPGSIHAFRSPPPAAGGFSYLSPQFGLSCDSMLLLEMVTAEGRVRPQAQVLGSAPVAPPTRVHLHTAAGHSCKQRPLTRFTGAPAALCITDSRSFCVGMTPSFQAPPWHPGGDGHPEPEPRAVCRLVRRWRRQFWCGVGLQATAHTGGVAWHTARRMWWPLNTLAMLPPASAPAGIATRFLLKLHRVPKTYALAAVQIGAVPAPSGQPASTAAASPCCACTKVG